jgi:3-methyladenine DNA glycosylase AlkD
MARYGIRSKVVWGVPVPRLRSLARELAPDHSLAVRLFRTGVHDARALAVMVEDPARLTAAQMERWVAQFDSWAICDGACQELFRKTPLAHAKILEWAERPEEFTRRAAFSLIAQLAVHDRRAPPSQFRDYLRLVDRAAEDPRNYVRKGVSWALRAIGKREPGLHQAAMALARRLKARPSPSARWVGAEALRELRRTSIRSVRGESSPAGRRAARRSASNPLRRRSPDRVPATRMRSRARPRPEVPTELGGHWGTS